MDALIWTDIPYIFVVDEFLGSYIVPLEVILGKFLQINASLDETQQEKLLKFLKEKIGAFAWEYTGMKGIHHNTCVHHIYIDDKITPLQQPQRRMNPTLKDIVKE